MANYLDVDKRGAYADDQDSPRAGSHWPQPHHGMVAEYQTSGIPFTFHGAYTASGHNRIVTITLPYVSQWVMVKASGTNTRIGFGNYDVSIAGAGQTVGGVQTTSYIAASSNLLALSPCRIKCKKILIWVADSETATYDIVAGLTNVRDFPSLDAVGLVGITTSLVVTDGGITYAAIETSAAE